MVGSLLAVVVAAVSGLHGTVMRGPTMPVCKVGVPCSAPAVGARLTFSRGGTRVALVRVGAEGRYRVMLPAGVYTVRLSPQPRIGFGIRPERVRVRAGVVGKLDFSVDTGIR